jgi:AcrR family transcriptional regulator
MVARIVAVARAELTEGDGVSLRRVAGRLGISAPALYRYIVSREQLLDLVVDAVDADIADRVAAVIGALPKSDRGEAMTAALTTFRSWALANHAEFSLVLGQSDARTGGSRRGGQSRLVNHILGLGPKGCDRRAHDCDECSRAQVLLAQAFGVICLEAFGHVDYRVVECGALFEGVTSQLAAVHGDR